MAVTTLRSPRISSTSEGLLTLEAAAAYLGIARGTLKHWALQRRIEYVKVGRYMRFTQAALDRFIASQTVSVQIEIP